MGQVKPYKHNQTCIYAFQTITFHSKFPTLQSNCPTLKSNSPTCFPGQVSRYQWLIRTTWYPILHGYERKRSSPIFYDSGETLPTSQYWSYMWLSRSLVFHSPCDDSTLAHDQIERWQKSLMSIFHSKMSCRKFISGSLLTVVIECLWQMNCS